MTFQNGNRPLHHSRMRTLEANDITPYAFTFDRSCHLIDIQQDFGCVLPGTTGQILDLRLCGRVKHIHLAEEGIFFDIEDQLTLLQFTLEYDQVGVEAVTDFQANVCPGDYVGFSVYRISRTVAGELTAYAYHWVMLAPYLRPVLPADGDTISDLMRPLAARENLVLRSKLVRKLRRSLEDWYDFLEVSLPTRDLPPKVNATFESTSDPEQKLLAPEESLLQLVSTGFETIYQLASVAHQNISSEHLYAYMTPADKNDMMGLTERLFRELGLELRGGTVLPWVSKDQLQLNAAGEDERKHPHTSTGAVMIDLGALWQQRPFYDLVAEITHVDFLHLTSPDEAVRIASALNVQGIVRGPDLRVGDVALAVFDQLVAPTLVQPTFVVDFPVETCRRAKRYSHNNRLIACAKLFINGLEFAQVETVATDLHESTERCSPQAPSTESENHGGTSPMPALRYGLPKVGSLVLNIDQLVMLFTGALDIRSVQFFHNTLT